MAKRITLMLNVLDDEGALIGAQPVGLTVEQIQDILDLCAEVVVSNRRGDTGMCEDAMDELDAILTATGVMEEFAPATT